MQAANVIEFYTNPDKKSFFQILTFGWQAAGMLHCQFFSSEDGKREMGCAHRSFSEGGRRRVVDLNRTSCSEDGRRKTAECRDLPNPFEHRCVKHTHMRPALPVSRLRPTLKLRPAQPVSRLTNGMQHQKQTFPTFGRLK